MEPGTQPSWLKKEAFRGCGKPERSRVNICVPSSEPNLDLYRRWLEGGTVLAPPSDSLRLAATFSWQQGDASGAPAKPCRFPLLQRLIGLHSLTTQRPGSDTKQYQV